MGGQQFLTHAHSASGVPAVKLRPLLADSRLELIIEATLVSFPLLQPEDLGIDLDTLNNFVNSSEADCSLTRCIMAVMH